MSNESNQVLIGIFRDCLHRGKQPTFSAGDLRYYIEELAKPVDDRVYGGFQTDPIGPHFVDDCQPKDSAPGKFARYIDGAQPSTQKHIPSPCHSSPVTDPYTGGAPHDPVKAHLAHCSTFHCEVCDGWRKELGVADRHHQGATHWANPDHSETVTAELKAHNLSMGGAAAAAVARYTIALGPIADADAAHEHVEDHLAKQIDILTIDRDALRTRLAAMQSKDWRTLADLVMQLGAEYWQAAVRERGPGAVQWMHNEETGALFVFTRGEYADELKDFLRQLPGGQERPVEICTRPPEGWTCTREPDHEGPCAASPVDGTDDQIIAAFEQVLCTDHEAYLAGSSPVYQVTQKEILEFARAIINSECKA